MNKKFILGFVILILSLTSVFAVGGREPIYWSQFVDSERFEAYGTISNDYNEGQFHLKDGIQVVFALTVTRPQEVCFEGGMFDPINGDIIPCDAENDEPVCLTSVNTTYYGYCDIDPPDINHTGHYFFVLETSGFDENLYFLEAVEIIDSQFSTLMWATLWIFIFFLVMGIVLKEGALFIPALMSLLVFAVDVGFNTFKYMFGFFGVGFVGIVFLLLVLTIKKVVDETMTFK